MTKRSIGIRGMASYSYARSHNHSSAHHTPAIHLDPPTPHPCPQPFLILIFVLILIGRRPLPPSSLILPKRFRHPDELHGDFPDPRALPVVG